MGASADHSLKMLAQGTVILGVGLFQFDWRHPAEPQSYDLAFSSFYVQMVISRHFGSGSGWVDRIGLSVHDKVVNSIFYIRVGLGIPKSRWELVSFSVKSKRGASSQYRNICSN